MQVQGKLNPPAQAALGALGSPSAQWIAACATTLSALRPHWSALRARRVARDLSRDLAHFDPVLAAEMEYESALCDD